jgi:hypothetical protein
MTAYTTLSQLSIEVIDAQVTKVKQLTMALSASLDLVNELTAQRDAAIAEIKLKNASETEASRRRKVECALIHNILGKATQAGRQLTAKKVFNAYLALGGIFLEGFVRDVLDTGVTEHLLIRHTGTPITYTTA